VTAFKEVFGLTTQIGDNPTEADLSNIQSLLTSNWISGIQYQKAAGYDGSDYIGTI